jgi:TatD DNase family protein
MKLVDVHCHLESDAYRESLDDVLADARRVGLIKLVTASITPEQWPVSRALAERYSEVECAWGVHPWYIKPEHESQLDGLYGARDAGVVAVGEIGLDRKVATPEFETQQRLFEAQLRIAVDVDLPLAIHCRGAFDDLAASFKRVGVPKRGGLIHSYSGSAEWIRPWLEKGIHASLGGALTYRNSRKKREVLQLVYPDFLLLETDSPDIPPVELKGQVNVPANIVYNLRAASEILGQSEETIAARTTANAARLFGWGGL